MTATPAPAAIELPMAGRSRLPPWISTRLPSGPQYPEVRGILHELGLGTVCREVLETPSAFLRSADLRPEAR